MCSGLHLPNQNSLLALQLFLLHFPPDSKSSFLFRKKQKQKKVHPVVISRMSVALIIRYFFRSTDRVKKLIFMSRALGIDWFRQSAVVFLILLFFFFKDILSVVCCYLKERLWASKRVIEHTGKFLIKISELMNKKKVL